MKIRKKLFLLPLISCLPVLLLLCGLPKAGAQDQRSFNRFQYHTYNWKALHTEGFHLYFPRAYDSLASFASVQLPDIRAEVKKDMGSDVQNIPNLILYPSVDQWYESNIGLSENKVQTFPTINLKGNRVLVAFNGSWEDFRLQLKEAWVRLNWEEQFKDNVAEQVTRKKQRIPSWFKKGSIRYFTKGWGIAEEDKTVVYVLDTNRYFPDLVREDEHLAGQAFCYFLSKKYREDAARQILFQLRQGKSLNRAVKLVTKRNLDTLEAQCTHFYRQRSHPGLAAVSVPADTLQVLLESRFQGRLWFMDHNEDYSYTFFVMARNNKREVYLAPTTALYDEKRKIKPFLTYLMPPWLDDYGKDPYPVMEWREKDKGISIVLPVKGHIVLQQYDRTGIRTDSRTLYGIDGLNTIREWQRDQYLLAAYRRGRSDVVWYDARKLRYTALTSGPADHNELTLSRAGGLIAYRSGYPADSLYHKDTTARDYGIYSKSIQGDSKHMAAARDKVVRTDTAYTRWQDPRFAATGTLSVSGTHRGYLFRENSNTKQDDYTAQAGTLSPWLQDYLADRHKKDSIRMLLDKIQQQDVSVLKQILAPGDTKKAARLHEDSIRKALAYTPKKVRPYVLQLYSAYFSAQVNNDYYINRYQPFRSYLGTFKFPEIGAMVQGGFSDLFDNHQFNIGYRLPAGTEGSDFFARYGNTAGKLDWHILYFRKMESLQADPERDWKDNAGRPYPQMARVKTHYYELGFHYPLHYDWSLDFTTAVRNDRTIFLATDRYSLGYEALKALWSMNSLSLQVNKLQPTIPFLYKGWEAKLMLDGMAATGKQATILYGTQVQFAYQQPLVREITVVAQLKAGYSAGDSKILYNFGGLDNNIVPRVDSSVRFGQDAPYAFQTLVTPFRGYEQNSIYGSRYGLLNLDVYAPLFYSLIPLKTSFSMVNDLQLGLFTDIAATGQPKGMLVVKSPLYAYGFSARTMLAGYPIRFDMAWPGTFDKQPVWYLSLSIK